jgi:uncharacterized membrane-anchored protein
MSFSRPRSSHRFAWACLVGAASVISAPSTGVAREGGRLNHEIDIPMLSAPTRQGFDEIIVQMAPLRPAPGAVAAKPAPAPGVAQTAKPAPVPLQEIKPAPVVEAAQQAAAKDTVKDAAKDAVKTEVAHAAADTAAKSPTTQPVQTAKDLDLKTGEPALPSTPAAVAPAAKPADQPVAPVAQQNPAQPPKGLDLKIGEAAMPSAPAQVPEAAKPAEPAGAPAPAAQQNPAPAAKAAKGPDSKIAEAAAPTAPAPVAEAAKPSAPALVAEAAKPSAPAPVAEAAKPSAPALVAEAAKPSAPAPVAEAAKPAEPAPVADAAKPSAPAPVAEAAKPAEPAAAPAPVAEPAAPAAQQNPTQAPKGPDLKAAEPVPPAPSAPTPVAEAAKPVDRPAAAVSAAATPAPVAKQEPKQEPKPSVEAAAVPNAQVQTPPDTPVQQNEKEAYAALLAQGVRGPVEVRLADRATLWLPANRVYLDGQQARNVFGAAPGWDNATQGVVLPTSSRPDWMAYVSLVDDGYVRDEDAQSMDPAAILGTFKAKVAADNSARARQGLAPLEVAGWMEAPRYDAKHRLSSCLRATLLGSQSPSDRFVNCSSFALGGQGAFKVIVSGEEASAPRFRGEASALAGAIAYDKGKGYEDVDAATVKKALYGLVALMGGGADFSKVASAQTAGADKQPGAATPLAPYVLKFGGVLLVGLGALVVLNRWMARKRQSAPGEAAEEQLAAAPQELAMEAQEQPPAAPQEPEPEPEAQKEMGGLAAKFAMLRAKLSSPFSRKASEPTPAASEPAPHPVAAESLHEEPYGGEAPAAALAKLATLMREKVLRQPPHVNLSRFEKHAQVHPASPLHGGAPMAAAKPAEEAAPGRETTPALDPFALIEPGDEAAASMAASARESLREAKG